jgi:hypothetical protein
MNNRAAAYCTNTGGTITYNEGPRITTDGHEYISFEKYTPNPSEFRIEKYGLVTPMAARGADQIGSTGSKSGWRWYLIVAGRIFASATYAWYR